ncbi:MAG: hypothetical protein Tsb0020_35090 [Haliangiales bacterium]
MRAMAKRRSSKPRGSKQSARRPRRKRRTAPMIPFGGDVATPMDSAEVEFYRYGLALHHPASVDDRYGATAMLFPPVDEINLDLRNQGLALCTCDISERELCAHIIQLNELYVELAEQAGVDRSPPPLRRGRRRLPTTPSASSLAVADPRTLGGRFEASEWYQMIALLAQDDELPVGSIELCEGSEDGRPVVWAKAADDDLIRATYFATGAARERFYSRVVLRPRDPSAPSRAMLLTWLMERTASRSEISMRAMGHRTHGQIIDESFWYRLAYHLYREHPLDRTRFAVAVDHQSGALTAEIFERTGGASDDHDDDDASDDASALHDSSADEPPNDRPREQLLVRLTVPQQAVRRFVRAAGPARLRKSMSMHPEPLMPEVRMSARADGGLRVEPVVRIERAEDAPIWSLEERFRYDDLAYVPGLDTWVPLAEPGPVGAALKLARPIEPDPDKTAAFLAKVAAALSQTPAGAPSEILGLQVLTRFDRVALDTRALGRDWCWLSMHYGSGASDITLDAILDAKRRGQRFVETTQGWVDTEAPAFAPLADLIERHQISSVEQLAEAADTPGSGLRMTRLALLRLLAASGDGARVGASGPGSDANSDANSDGSSPLSPLAVDTSGAAASGIDDLLEVKPTQPLAPLAGLRSTLRDYQTRGVEWLLYLYDNRFGGLLCDDMGLGKTHQVMAFLVALREQRAARGPFLVVCPTTVLSHWLRLLQEFAPALSAAVLHGSGRDLDESLRGADVLLTSYGILRNDIAELSEVSFTAAIFDEAQLLKNPQTRAYQAAAKLAADLRIGLSGTPIENSLADLEALFDLTLPGYLGGREAFRARFLEPIEQRADDDARRDLQRLIAPFTLRRSKGSVLDQLPSKIEDTRTCLLSDEQVKLYRDAIESRGQELIQALQNLDQPVPYIHIFALLTLLKQICCHPALVTKTPERYQEFESGKWELAKELLRDSLASGQKVVVYSQFLGMLSIFEHHLKAEGVGYTKLTGRTRKRGEAIERFQEDPDCRVFLASLTAGGVGIDLIAASVVMHYDRWWNAAREDQATDRVHRIGQTRGVHVFKLVTEGTLEEKIAAIIAKKRHLMESVVATDDKASLKTLSRDELAALIEFS